MKRSLFTVLCAFLLFSVSCASAGDTKQTEVKPAETKAQEKPAEDFGMVGNAYLKLCRNEIASISGIASEIKTSAGKKSGLEILNMMNILEIKQSDMWSKSGIFQLNHPDEGMRKAAMKCETEISAQATELSLDNELYKAIASISPGDPALDSDDKYFLADMIIDFKRNGVDKDEATRDAIKKLSAEIIALEQTFYSNIGSDKKTIKIKDVNRLKGLPEDFIKGKKPDEEGNIILTTDWPDYFPVMENAQDESLRAEMYKNVLNIAYPQNTEIFSKILKARKKFSELLGYKNFAEYTQQKLMIENPENADEFIKKVAGISTAYAKKDLEVFLAKKKSVVGETAEVEPWDRFFYQKLIKMEKYNYDPEQARKYFEMTKVIDGIFLVSGKIFGVTFEKVKRDDLWHESVQSYNMLADGKVIGMFELDLFPRPNKYKHFAMFTNELGVKDLRIPRAAIIGNFPEPVDGKAYISHEDVQTLFHEFGHLLHSLFAGNQRYVRFSGTNCQRDFVEVPSQLMEEYVWDASILQLWATNDAGEPIPADLVDNMKKASEFAKGLHVSRQMYLAALSLGIYLQDPENFDHHAYEKKLEKELSPWKSHEDTHLIENFSHLVNYYSNYYTYMWSLAIVKDFAGHIRKTGLMDAAVTKQYRDKVLNIGGAKPGHQMVKDFLGRELSFEEFEKWLNN
ncbi:MAG TPA: M3 family metallopeptidase [bacterium]|nr:Zn-dependent oligopeptidase [bacterium]MDX9806427.1 M3 family metallopeptidase [bacterium]HOG42516.1 M3 family metallopeptidase [bacterium]